jgi:hypothetical protein
MSDQHDAADAVDGVPHAYSAVEAAGGDVLVGGVKYSRSDAKLVALLIDLVFEDHL